MPAPEAFRELSSTEKVYSEYVDSGWRLNEEQQTARYGPKSKVYQDFVWARDNGVGPRTYSQVGKRTHVDDAGREYRFQSEFEHKEAKAYYVRPKGKTAAANRLERQHIIHPMLNEVLLLRPIRDKTLPTLKVRIEEFEGTRTGARALESANGEVRLRLLQ